MSNIKVSVIVPVFNEEKYLAECLDSILEQTLKDIEVICVDAGSTDTSLEILHAYAEKDARLSVYGGDERLDAGTARNIGLSHATGEFLSFLDSDDYFDEHMLEDAYNKAQSEQSDIVIYYAQQLDMRTEEITPMPWSLNVRNCPKRSSFAPSDMAQRLFNSFQNWTWNKLFRAKLIKENNISFQAIMRTNDMAFTCEALALARRISILPKTYVTYRVGTGTSLQQTNDISPTCFWDAYLETKNRLIKAGVYEKFRRSFVNAVMSGTMYNLRSVKSDVAFREILYLVKYHANVFELDQHNKAFFYSKTDFANFKKYRASMRNITKVSANPKVSVVLPCLNSRTYMRECLESVMEQTLTNIEIIVVDAGSTDGTLDLLEDYKSRDCRIQIINSDKKSYGYQMNLGLNRAKGQYFAIVESDDYIRPTMYEDLCKIADANDLEVLKADYCIFTGERNGRKYTTKAIATPRSLYNTVIDPAEEPDAFRSYVVSWCGIYNTEFLKKNKIYHHESPGASFQDNGFWFQVFTQAHRMMFCNKQYYMLRRDNPGSSVFSASKAYCMFNEYDFIRGYLTKHPELEEKYAGLCAYKRFKNYMWANDNLVTAVNREEYINRCSEAFKAILESGEIDPEWYTEAEYEELMKLINTPEEFLIDCVDKDKLSDHFVGPLTADVYIQKLQGENEACQRAIRQKNRIISQRNNEIRVIKSSTAYRVGRFVTWVPRKCKRFVQCCQDHGFIYSLKYGFKKASEPILRVHRKIPNGIQCLKDHGFVYTVQYFFRKLKK